MKTKLLVAIGIAVAVGFGAGWFVGHKPATKPEESQTQHPSANVPVMPQPRAPDFAQLTLPTKQSVKIPLNKVYTTSGQKGLQPLPEPPNERWARHRRELVKHLNQSAASNAFLVVAPDFHAATIATNWTYSVTFPERIDVIDRDSKIFKDPDVGSNVVWLHVFLGSGSEDHCWRLKTIDIEENSIIFRYSTFKDIVGIAATHYWGHAYWAPMPASLPVGELMILLEEDSEPTPRLTRRVTIK